MGYYTACFGMNNGFVKASGFLGVTASRRILRFAIDTTELLSYLSFRQTVNISIHET